MFLGLGNIYIINIYCIIFIINIYLLWTNRGQCPHPFTDISLSYFNNLIKVYNYLVIACSSDKKLFNNW